MIEFLLAALVGAVGVLGFLVVRATRTRDTDEGVVSEMHERMIELARAQQTLVGKVDAVGQQQVITTKTLTDTLSNSQKQLSVAMNERLETVQERMGSNLSESAKSTAKSLGELSQRLETIDKAQKNITDLSEQVVSLQHVLDDKHARGAFGEVQLIDLVKDVLPPSAYGFQVVLSNSRRADCVITLPNPPGPIVIDAKFPLTAYSAMMNAKDDTQRARHSKQLGADTKKHIRDIADRYILVGETSDSALMFIPSEAVYAELHAHHPDVVELSHRLKVFLVSPTTMMATLTTVRAVLRDVRMREQAGLIQIEVSTMLKDVERMMDRVRKLESHFDLADRDIKDIRISANKISTRGTKIEELELSESEDQPAALTDPDTLPFHESR
ncbi:MAG: DNA recombination protein RmuC [Actinomycetia bacterium]|nr:DNA recombination protein RmuC [Actinomycetes bacterium]